MLEKESDRKYNDERGHYATQSGGYATRKFLQLVADKDGYVDGEDSRHRLRNRHQVQELLLAYPFVAVYHLFFDERNHGVSAADGKEAYLKECGEQSPIGCRGLYVIVGFQVVRMFLAIVFRRRL